MFKATADAETALRLFNMSEYGVVDVACACSTFTEHTDQVPVRARMTTRLKDAVAVAVVVEARAVSGVAAAFGVSWASVPRQVRSAGRAWRLRGPRVRGW